MRPTRTTDGGTQEGLMLGKRTLHRRQPGGAGSASRMRSSRDLPRPHKHLLLAEGACRPRRYSRAPTFVQVLRHDLGDHDLVSAGTGGIFPPQATGRGAAGGRKSCEAFGQLAGEGAEQFAPVRVLLVVFERGK